jgi:hypothetical protein
MRVGIGEADRPPATHRPSQSGQHQLVRRLKYFRNVWRKIYNAIGAGAYLAAKSRRPTRNLVQSAGKFSSSNIRICSNNITGHIPR